jgi:arylsulfatase A-like enzyme
LFADWAVEYLKGRKGAQEPFFLYFAFNAPHTPIQPPSEWLERVRGREPEIDDRRARLVALIEHMDHAAGRVMGALQENGQVEDTLVIFLSDNGGQLDVGARVGPYRGGKQDLYEGGIRVPAVMRWPGRIAPGSRSENVALSMDLFPTILDAAGAEAVSGIDGISILPHLLNPENSLPERDLFWVRREGGRPYYGLDYHAARRGRWKLMRNHPFEAYQLYDLEDDPGERRDRSADERAIFDDLIRAMQGHLQEAARVPWQRPKWN